MRERGQAPPAQEQSPKNQSPKAGRLAAATKADAAERVRRLVEPVHGKHPGVRAVIEVAAAEQGAGASSLRGPSQAVKIPGKQCAAAATRKWRHPVGYPLPEVPHHIKDAEAGNTVGVRAGVDNGERTTDIAVRSPIVRPGIGRPGRCPLPLGIGEKPLPRIDRGLLRLKPGDETRGRHPGNRHGEDGRAVVAVVVARVVVRGGPALDRSGAASKDASVAVPALIAAISVVLALPTGIPDRSHTLASYLSTQVRPTSTLSAGQAGRRCLPRRRSGQAQVEAKECRR
jgi:hypothetical protein